jgi:serine protease AprX
MSTKQRPSRRARIDPLTHPEVRRALLAGRPVQKRWRHLVTDLEPLAGLTNLTRLDLSSTGVSDVTPLAGLANLTHLNLFSTGVSDVTPLAGLANLTSLDLFGTGVSDVTPLAGLANLTRLDLSSTGVSDVTPLAGLANLTSLDLRSTGVSDVTPLAGLANLTSLDLRRTGVSDVTPLAGLANLTRLDLSSTGVSDVTPLAGLANLTSLDLRSTGVSDVTPLAGLANLTSLDLRRTGVSDVTPLAGLANLTSLDLDGTGVSDVTPLAGLTNLTRLGLRRTGVSDVTPLAWLTNLTSLDLDGTGVSDVTPLAGLTNLTFLVLDGTGVSDVTPLASLLNLRYLSLRGTNVEDISVLANIQGLEITGFEKSDGEVGPSKAVTGAPLRVSQVDGAEAFADRAILRFDNMRWLNLALAVEGAGPPPRVISRKRTFIAFERPEGTSVDQFQSMLADLSRRAGARVIPDHRYSLEHDFSPAHTLPVGSVEAEGTLADVLRVIGADRLDNQTRGQHVSIAIVDTGINGARAEFAPARRAAQWAVGGDDPWTDEHGHGTMCATIAAATQQYGGTFRGVAPGAGLIACKTSFLTSELTAIYESLETLARQGHRIVASNSYGQRTETAPLEPDDYDLLMGALDDAVEAGVHVVFSAGNYHHGDRPCDPTTIWLQKCRADVLTVATCDLHGEMWNYSSRGLGQFNGQNGMAPKPDVTAPTPKNGLILFGGEERIMPDGWGTSGAAPQVAGLLALLLSDRRNIPRDDLFAIVRETAVKLGTTSANPGGLSFACQGHGRIDCLAAVERSKAGVRADA